jgi:hypothetical protein
MNQPDRHRIQEVQLFPAPPARDHEARVLEDAEVLHHAKARHLKLGLEVGERAAVTREEPVEQEAPRRVGKSLEQALGCPVYGAIPTRVDEVRVVLDDDGDIPALILRPEGHRFAYYLAWLPDPYASGEVRFASGSQVLGARELCASDVRERSDRRPLKKGFTCATRVRAP